MNQETEIDGQAIQMINRRWRWRRRIAFISLFSFLLTGLGSIILFIFFPHLSDFSTIITTFLTLQAALPATYMGLSTLPELKTASSNKFERF